MMRCIPAEYNTTESLLGGPDYPTLKLGYNLAVCRQGARLIFLSHAEW